jgi:hypothetical protein
MTRVHRRLACMLFTLSGFAADAALGGQGKEPDANFKVPRAEILSTIKTIGVMPTTVSADVPDPDGVAARYENEIVVRLADAGFSVTPPSAMREIRERAKVTLGGFYDPMTGRPIKEKLDAFNEFGAAEYRASHKVDALLQSAIVLRSAEFNFGRAYWDGVTDSSSGRSGLGDFMMSMTGITASGRIPALSFWVRLVDGSGKLLYEGAGGLQVLGYARVGIRSGVLATTREIDVNAKYIMTDPARDARALSLALDPLVLGSVSVPAKIASPPIIMTGAGGAATGISRQELLTRYPRIALAPLELEDIGQRDDVPRRYRDALTLKLTQLGFEVVGGNDYGRLWDAERMAVHGFFDPFTGRPDERKLKASRMRVFEAMQGLNKASAVLLSALVARTAPFNSGAAEWDGVKESLTPGKGKLGALFDPVINYAGHLSAVSLEVHIIDPAGATLFEGSGGIQLTEHFVGRERAALPDGEILSNAFKDERAVNIAFATLAQKP